MSKGKVPEKVADVAHALVETQQLRAWFYALERLPLSLRETAFSHMAAHMRSAGEDPTFAEAVASLGTGHPGASLGGSGSEMPHRRSDAGCLIVDAGLRARGSSPLPAPERDEG